MRLFRRLLFNLDFLNFLKLIIFVYDCFLVYFIFIYLLLIVTWRKIFQIWYTSLPNCRWEFWVIILVPFQVLLYKLLNLHIGSNRILTSRDWIRVHKKFHSRFGEFLWILLFNIWFEISCFSHFLYWFHFLFVFHK